MAFFGPVGKRENAKEYRANLRFVSMWNDLLRMSLSRKCLMDDRGNYDARFF